MAHEIIIYHDQFSPGMCLKIVIRVDRITPSCARPVSLSPSPKHSMYRMHTYIDPWNHSDIGKYASLIDCLGYFICQYAYMRVVEKGSFWGGSPMAVP